MAAVFPLASRLRGRRLLTRHRRLQVRRYTYRGYL